MVVLVVVSLVGRFVDAIARILQRHALSNIEVYDLDDEMQRDAFLDDAVEHAREAAGTVPSRRYPESNVEVYEAEWLDYDVATKTVEVRVDTDEGELYYAVSPEDGHAQLQNWDA